MRHRRTFANESPVSNGDEGYGVQTGKIGMAIQNKRDFSLSQWVTPEQGKYRPSGKTVKEIPAGLYAVESTPQGFQLATAEFPTDELVRFSDGPVELVVQQIERFWQRADVYKQFGLLHKRGMLLYGVAGCGKSSVIKLVTEDVIKRNGIVVITDSAEWMPTVFRMIREIERERSIVNIIEDIDSKMEDHDDSVALLSLLDGEHQVDNILHIATTNYPEKLEERIVQRPGRFDMIVRMGLPSALARQAYLQRFAFFKEGVELEQWVAETEGLGIAHLREMIAAVKCLGLDYTETLERLRENKKRAPKRMNEKEVGFEVQGVTR